MLQIGPEPTFVSPGAIRVPPRFVRKYTLSGVFDDRYKILKPSDDTLLRLIVGQREIAKEYIYNRITDALAEDAARKFDSLIETDDTRISPFQTLKQPPGRSSPSSILKIIERLEITQSTGFLDIDISWLNNNFQRALARYAKQCTVTRLDNIQQAAILYSNSRYRHQ